MTSDPRPMWAIRLQEERETRAWNKFEMARRLYGAAGMTVTGTRRLRSLVRQIYGWESGEHFPREWARAYATAYGITEEELFGDTEHAPPVISEPAGTLTSTTVRTLVDWMSSMERRNLLMLMGFGVTAPWPVAENLRTALTRTAGASDSLADWRETVSDYWSLMSTTPPARLLPALLSDLNEVNALLEAGHPERKPLLEVAAALATFTSMSTYDSGNPAGAFRWWRTAQHLADRSGHAPIRAYVRARRGADLFYGRKQPGQALWLADEAVRIAGDRPSVGLAEAHALRATTLAAGGDPTARTAIDDMARTADRLGGGEAYAPAWPAALRIQGTRTITHVKLGDGAAAVRAGSASPQAQTQMYVAAGLILQGKIDDGLGHAVNTLSRLAPVDDTFSTRRKGWDVLALVPERARDSSTARALRELTQGGPAT